MTKLLKPCLPLVFSTVLFLMMTGTIMGKTIKIPFDAANFSAFPDPINNQYWPLTVSSSHVYKAVTEDECEFNKLTVTSDTYYLAEVNVMARIIRDQEWVMEISDDGSCDVSTARLVEDTLDYYAQDMTGNIWYFGENTWAWDDETGQCTSAGSWEAGKPVGDPEIDPAQPGIVMLAMPKRGDRYRQEFLEDEAEDMAAVLRLNASVLIELGEFSNCLVTKEWTPLEPGGIEHKHYCLTPGTNGMGSGLVLIKELKGKTKHVEFIGSSLPGDFPGDNDVNFPADALGCNGP